MTEDEAKTKWCPMNRFSYSNCVGSKCAMWRWKHVKNPEWQWLDDSGKIPRHPADSPSAWKNSDTEGYCGLARGYGI